MKLIYMVDTLQAMARESKQLEVKANEILNNPNNIIVEFKPKMYIIVK